MSAGRLQLFETRASLRDRTSRLLVRLRDGRELRLREFGTRQRAWVKVIRMSESEDTLEELGYDAWPDPPELLELLEEPRALSAVRRSARGGVLRGLRDVLLPRLPDRGAGAQGPAPLAPVEVGSRAMALEAGDQAPDFTLADQHGEQVSLSGLRGQTVVLY